METEIWFGPIKLNRLHCTLHGPRGTARIHQKACDVLSLLIENYGRAVPRDEIIARVWAGRVVGEGGVAVHVSACRTAFGEVAGKPEAIITLRMPVRYQFCLEPTAPAAAAPAPENPIATPVAPLDEPAPAQSLLPCARVKPDSTKNWRHGLLNGAKSRTASLVVAGGVVALAATAGIALWADGALRRANLPRLSIVVLPFTTDVEDRGVKLLASAITDDLTIDLGHIPQSTVIARASAEVVAKRGLTLPEIGRLLRVRYILSGSLFVEGATYEIAVQLNDARTGALLWGRTSGFQKAEAGELRRTIEGNLANSMNFQIDRLESTRSLSDWQQNPDAEDLFFQARSLVDTRESIEVFNRAALLLRQAIKVEHDFSDALAELGWVLLRKHWLYNQQDQGGELREAHDAIEAALRLSPSNVTALAAQGLEYETRSQYPEAEHLASEALELQSSSTKALSVLIGCAWSTGDLGGIARYLSLLDLVDPFGDRRIKRMIMRADVDLMTSQPANAVKLLRNAIADTRQPAPGDPSMDVPEDARILLLAAYALNKDIPQAKAEFKSFAATYPNRSVWRVTSDLPPSILQIYRRAGIIEALHASGMPFFASEENAQSGDCSGDAGEYAPTPRVWQHTKVYDTPSFLEALKEKSEPIVIDAGSGVQKPDGALWAPHDSDPANAASYVDAILAGRHAIKKGTQIIVMGSGLYGCNGFLAAQHLIRSGYSEVGWYRPGEEGLAQAPAIRSEK